MKKLLLALLTPLYLLACPFDEANIEVTIIAHMKINEALKEDDFNKAKEAIQSNEELYRYFGTLKKEPIYQPLLAASAQKATQKIDQILAHVLYLEIEELLGKVETSFSDYQKSRLLIIKAKKHLLTLTKDKKAMKHMKKILASIGNPGLMGVGYKKANKESFLEHQKALLAYIKA